MTNKNDNGKQERREQKQHLFLSRVAPFSLQLREKAWVYLEATQLDRSPAQGAGGRRNDP
jgi:hypothetical protein